MKLHAVAYDKAKQKHGEPCRVEGMVFIPLVVEILGGWEEPAVSQIKRIGAALARQMGQDEAEKQINLFQN